MTCIAALIDKKGNIYMAGDRRITWGSSKAIASPNPKIERYGDILVGAAGSSPICEAVLDFTSTSYFNLDSYDMMREYLSVDYIPSLINSLRKDNWIKDDERRINVDNEENSAATILLGLNSSLFEVSLSNEMISYEEVNSPYTIGSGSELALGSLHTSKGSKLGCKARLKVALKVAAMCCPECDDNIDILDNRNKEN